MLSIFGALLGILGSAIPEFIKIWKGKQEMEHEFRMFEAQVKYQEKMWQFKMQEIEAQADISESQALYKASEIKLTGWKFIDGIIALYNSSVRPTVTYLFLAFYGLAKAGQYTFLKSANLDASTLNIMWTLFSSEDMALFATIIGYWFGQRGMRYAFEHIAPRGRSNGGYSPY